MDLKKKSDLITFLVLLWLYTHSFYAIMFLFYGIPYIHGIFMHRIIEKLFENSFKALKKL